jgi:putative ABC transport system substrate-binding protein
MRRREFIALVGGAIVASPFTAGAQQGEPVRQIGVLMGFAESDQTAQSWVAAFHGALAKLGWAEGSNLRIELRWGAADPDRVRTLAKQLVDLRPDAIFDQTTPVTNALARETQKIPIVFVYVADQIGSGFAPSLARPGGNITGFTYLEPTTGGKWVGLLKEVAPRTAHVAVLFNPATTPPLKFYMPSIQAAASSLAVEASSAPVHATDEIEGVIAAQAHNPSGGLLVMPDVFNDANRELIIALARIAAELNRLASLGRSARNQSMSVEKTRSTPLLGWQQISTSQSSRVVWTVRTQTVSSDSTAFNIKKSSVGFPRRIKDGSLISPYTVNDTTEQLKKLFTRAKAWGARFDHEPTWRDHWLDEPQERVRELHDDEGERLDAAMRDDLAPFFAFARASGMRLQECLLRWSEVDWSARQIRKAGKGGKLVTLPITSAIREILWPLREHHPEHVFTYQAQTTRESLTIRPEWAAIAGSISSRLKAFRRARVLASSIPMRRE